MSYTTNLHHPIKFYVNGIKYQNDWVMEEYVPQIQAFLTRRRTTKREVPPKVHIMEDMGEDFQATYR